MDWTLVLIAIGFAALLGMRSAVGIYFPESWVNTLFDTFDACAGGDAGDSGDADGGGDGGD